MSRILNQSLWMLLVLHKTKVTLQNNPVLTKPFQTTVREE